MLRFLRFAPLLGLIALCGCSIIPMEPYRQTVYFDISPTEREVHRDVAYSTVFSTSAMPFSDRMLFKVGGDKMEFDEYHRWVATPETLLRRYLESSFSMSSDATAIQLRILRFDLDKQANTATCEVQVSLTNAKNATTRSFKASATVKAKANDYSDYAEAMHGAIAQIVAQIAAELKKGS